jgi:hypothetical protein
VSVRPSPTTLTFGSIADGGLVRRFEDVTVDVTDLPSTQQVWLMVRFLNESTVYPRSCTAPSRAVAVCSAQFGEDTTAIGTAFEVTAVAVDTTGATGAYKPFETTGFPQTSPPLQPLASSPSITVTRTSSPAVRITAPADSGLVNQFEDVTVDVTDLPSTQQVWLMVQFLNEPSVYPQGPCTPAISAATVVCSAQFGEDNTPGRSTFVITAVTVDKATAANVFKPFEATGFPQTSPPLQPLATSITVTVTRNPAPPFVGPINVNAIGDGNYSFAAPNADRCASLSWVLSGPVTRSASTDLAPDTCYATAPQLDTRSIPSTKLDPGNYTITLTIRSTKSGLTAASSTSFTVP